MAFRIVYTLFISLLLYEHASGEYCPNDVNSAQSIQFCQSGTISGSKLYINGSSVQTKENLKDKGCVCYVEQSGNSQILVNTKESCVFCGVQVEIEGSYFRAAGTNPGWGSLPSNSTKIKMTMGLDDKIHFVNTAFCIEILGNNGVNIPLNLTCKDIAIKSSAAISESPSVMTTIQYRITDTGTTNVTRGQMANNTNALTTITTNSRGESTFQTPNEKTTQSQTPTSPETATTRLRNEGVQTTIRTNSPGESTFQTQDRVIIPAAAGGGAGLLVILCILIVFCCLRKRKPNEENPTCMKEHQSSNSIMTENVAYGICIDSNTNAVPHIQSHSTGDVYAVVNKNNTSKGFPSAEIPHMQVGENGDVYAMVNKENVLDTPNTDNSREEVTSYSTQTKSDENNAVVDIHSSCNYSDITI